MVLTDNLQLFLDGEENSSDTEYYGVTGTVDGLSFDGINDYIDVPLDISSANTQGSITLFVNYNSSTAGERILREDTAGYFTLECVSSSSLKFTIYDSAFKEYTFTGLTSGTDYYLTMVWDNSEVRFFKNGVFQNSTAFSGISGGGTSGFLVGKSDTNYYDGSLKQLAVYDTKLSDANVLSLYNGAEITANRIYYNSGKTLTDKSNNNSPVTLSGAVTSDDGFVFDGTNDKVTASSTILGLGDKSGSFKIKFDTLPEYGYIMGNEQVGLSGFDIGFELYTVGTTMSMMIGKAAAGHYLTCGATVTTGVEYIFTWKQESNQLFMYKDNVLFASDLISDGTEGAGSVNFHAGVTTNGLQMFDGVLSDIALYDKALSTEEITALSNDEEITDSRVFFHNGKALNSKSTAHNGVIVNSDGEYEFDGTNDYITTEVPEMGTGSRTYSMWFKTGTVSATSVLFWDRNAYNDGACVYLGTSGTGVLRSIFEVGGSQAASSTSSLEYDDDTWYHLVAVYERGVGQKIYINGNSTAVCSGTCNTGSVTTGIDTFIGSISDGTYSFGGSMRNVCVWDTALSTADILELYNNDGSPIITSSGKLIFGVEMTKVNGISFIKMNGV